MDSENALVGCTLEHWRLPVSSVPTSEDLKSIWNQVAAICYWSIFKISPNPIAKCAQGCRAAGGGPPTLKLSILYYNLKLVNPFPKPIENVVLSAKWNVTFEIDSENALVGCTLEHWRPPVELFEEIGNFRRLKINYNSLGGHLPSVPF